MEIERRALVVYYNHPKAVRNLSQFGDLKYVSKKQHYAYLYIDCKERKKIAKEISNMRGIKKVEYSLYDLASFDFKININENKKDVK